MNKWTFGDPHGELEKLKDIFKIAPIEKGDTIISLGDIVDRGPKSFECVQLLIDMQKDYNMIFIKGNHDYCFFEGVNTGRYMLMGQGCEETLESYIRNCNPDKTVNRKFSGSYTDFEFNDMPIEHHTFFNNQLDYYIDEDNNCFVHGGFNRHKLIEEETDKQIFIWDRDLLGAARSYSSMKNNEYPFKMKNNFKNVFIGHTPTLYFGISTPVNYANIWDVDTGCGKSNDAKLSIMNVETKEYYQSR
jgi:serine/threonine protein phosphatase 1